MNDLTDKIIVERSTPPSEWRCVRCGQMVAPADDVFILRYLMYRETVPTLAVRDIEHSQHLHPRNMGTKYGCLGSPSNLQYLPDQPRDTRGLRDYEAAMEPLVREAYAQLDKVVVVQRTEGDPPRPTSAKVI